MAFLCSILLVSGYILYHNVIGKKLEDTDINDFFASSFQGNDSLSEIPDIYFKNFPIDIEHIDPQRIRRKFEILQPEIRKKEEIVLQSRRQTLTFKGYNESMMRNASEYMTRTKLADLMLQTIYMTRQKFKDVENTAAALNIEKRTIPKINTDPDFKLGHVLEKMAEIVKRLRAIVNSIRHYSKRYITSNKIHGTSTIGPTVILHTKSVKLYVDFCNLWEVMMKATTVRMKKEGKKYKLAPGDMSGGITEEDSWERRRRRPRAKIPNDK